MLKPLPSQEHLNELFRYDVETGLLYWRVGQCRGKRAGTRHKEGRWYVSFGRRRALVHRVIWKMVYNAEPPMVDHINCDNGDNRLANLRAATHSQNNSNQRTRRNGLKGAYYHKASGLWTARVSLNGRLVYSSYHKTEQEAHEAYLVAAKTHYGAFARAA